MSHAHEVNAFGALALEVADRVQRAGTVRLVDRLAADGLAERRVGADGRSLALQLTPSGRREARRALARREAAIARVLAPLTGVERATLARLHERLLTGLTLSQQERRRLCRLCDVDACGRDCPATYTNPRLET
jgi:hypothetical protein